MSSYRINRHTCKSIGFCCQKATSRLAATDEGEGVKVEEEDDECAAGVEGDDEDGEEEEDDEEEAEEDDDDME